MMNRIEKQHVQGGEAFAGQIKRRSRRVGISGFVGDLANGNSIVCGNVENISKTGFRFTNAPASFSAEKHTYTIILSRQGEHYRVLAKPCWRRPRGKNKTEIGFKILEAPWEWLEFTTREIPEFDYSDSTGFMS